MFDSTVQKLLAALDPLDFPARNRWLAAETLRLARRDGGLDGVLDELATGDEYQRWLALTMAKIAGRTDRLISGLTDPLFRIRVVALFACARVPETGTDAAILATLDDAPVVWRRKVVEAVSAAKRTDLADRLAGQPYRDRLGEAATARLLPVCSHDVAARLLPGLVHKVPNWARLGIRHPQLMIDSARHELAATPAGSRDRWWWTGLAGGLAAAAERLPLRVLDVLEEFPAPEGLPGPVLLRINPLIRADPGRALRLLTVPDGLLEQRWRKLTQSTRKRLAVSGQPEIEAVGRAVRDDPAALAALLHRLPPHGRAAFYDAVTAGKEASTELLAHRVLDELPRERRHAEVRRMLTLSALADRPDERLSFIARLPWNEARPELRAAVRRADPDKRAAAYPLLIRCAAAEGRPAAVTELLTGELGRLRNEQDPVRREALGALSDVPARLFEDTSVVAEALRNLVTDALEARDCSYATRDALDWLMCRVLASQATGIDINAGTDAAGSGPGELLAWSLTAFEQVAGSTGVFEIGRLDRVLRRGQEIAVCRVLQPWIARGMERADHRLAFALARALGRRAWKIPSLQDALAHAIWHGTTGTARFAIVLWLDDPEHRDERVAKIVAWDATAAVLERVAELLSVRRTDLLDAYLFGSKPITGKFIAHGARWVPALQPSYRWLPRQRAAYAGLLARIAADAGAAVRARVAAIRSLGALPGEGEDKVLRYLDSTNVPLAEAAIGALAWSDDPAAVLPVLFGYAGGDRARVAVYAAGRAARFARPSAVAPVLRSVALSPDAKVASRKAALRIAADLDLPHIADLLEEVWRVPGQHRDVKAAVASRLAALMDDARVPALLHEAVNEDPEIARQLLGTRPLEMPERHRAAYGELIAVVCGNRDPSTSQTALLAAPKWYRWTDTVAVAVCAALTDLERRGGRAAPSSAVVALLREGMPVLRYLEVLDALLVADARSGQDDGDGGDDGYTGRDAEDERLARRRVAGLVECLAWARRNEPVERRPALRATVKRLIGCPGYVRLAVSTAAEAVELDASPDDLTRELGELADHARGRRDAAAKAGEILWQKIMKRQPWDPAAVSAAAEALARRGDSEGALIAVRLMAAAGYKLGWPEPYRLGIRSLRHHSDPAVAEEALDVTIDPA